MRMMFPIALYTLASPLHKGLPPIDEDPFIIEVEKELGAKFKICGDDFTNYSEETFNLIFIRTGGTEGLFKKIRPGGYIRLLTSGSDNSLAAAMEILSFIQQEGGKGEIIHGTPAQIANKLNSEAPLASGKSWERPLPDMDFGGARLGVIGKPSDWLIASGVDYAKAKRKLNVELIDIDIRELIDAVNAHDCDLRSFSGSEAVYEELLGIVSRYGLDGLTLRCFDLLDSVGNTGCLALARLNADGIPASCEGDIPALLTMMLAKLLNGCPGFQCNLSRIMGEDLLFAHCTVPLSMVGSYSYKTHFESGIGTAIKGELPPGQYTIMKIAPDLDSIAAIPAELVSNRSEAGLCRTQIVLNAPGAAEYFLGSPLANHHIVVPGINKVI